MRNYLTKIQDELVKREIYIYVLRNRTRGKGIGFFESYGFYPDFIIWIKKQNIQHILFVEPHGLAYASERDKEKINLYEKIKNLEKELKKKTHLNVTLDSYIISVTQYNSVSKIFRLSKNELKNKHILFIDDKSYVKELIEHFIK